MPRLLPRTPPRLHLQGPPLLSMLQGYYATGPQSHPPRENRIPPRHDGLWEGIVTLPSPPHPPFDIETMEPIEQPWQAIEGWVRL